MNLYDKNNQSTEGGAASEIFTAHYRKTSQNHNLASIRSRYKESGDVYI